MHVPSALRTSRTSQEGRRKELRRGSHGLYSRYTRIFLNYYLICGLNKYSRRSMGKRRSLSRRPRSSRRGSYSSRASRGISQHNGNKRTKKMSRDGAKTRRKTQEKMNTILHQRRRKHRLETGDINADCSDNPDHYIRIFSSLRMICASKNTLQNQFASDSHLHSRNIFYNRPIGCSKIEFKQFIHLRPLIMIMNGKLYFAGLILNSVCN